MNITSDQGELSPETPEQFVIRLNLPFKNHALVSRALTHRSYVNEYKEALEDNERLEFLGDAVLDFLVGAWLYNHFPEMKEGELTRLRRGSIKGRVGYDLLSILGIMLLKLHFRQPTMKETLLLLRENGNLKDILWNTA